MSELTPADPDGYLAAQGRNTGLRPWQFVQWDQPELSPTLRHRERGQSRMALI